MDGVTVEMVEHEEVVVAGAGWDLESAGLVGKDLSIACIPDGGIDGFGGGTLWSWIVFVESSVMVGYFIDVEIGRGSLLWFG